MNPDQSFYYEHDDDWQYPSPSSTPQSSKHASLPFGDLNTLQTSQSLLDTNYSGTSGYMEGPSGAARPRQSTQSKIKAPQPASASTSSKKRKPQISFKRVDPTQPPSRSVTQSQHNATLTSSFLEQFDGASLQEPFSGWSNMEPIDESMSHMQTPPPTRDPSTKRKPQQPPIKFSTPSTVKSRTQSAPGNDWLKRSVDQAPLEASPVTFTPLQFSPPAMNPPFSTEGPATAPAYPQANIFWGQDSHNDPDMMSFSTQMEDTFVQGMDEGLIHDTTQWPSQKASSRVTGVKGVTGPHSTYMSSSSYQSSRPQSARPATTSASDPVYDQLSTSGVDPSVLWSNQISDTRQLVISEPATSSSTSGISPYQYQMEELKRQKEQKEHQRLIRSSFRKSRSSTSTSGDAAPSLRRSLTDSRSRRSILQSSFSDPVEYENDLVPANVPRHSSPLKRQRVDEVAAGHRRSSESAKKSIVLAVDENGRARTVVQTIPEPIRSASRSIYTPANDDSDSDSAKDQAAGGRLEMPAPTRYDAQEALRVMKLERQKRKSQPSHVMPRLKTKAAVDTAALDDISPNTITDDELQHSLTARGPSSSYAMRCICNNNAATEYVLQCESCRHWSHLECLGIEHTRAPPVYVCDFCASTPPAQRGGSLRSNKHRQQLQSEPTGQGQAPYYR